jgi:DNA-binding response OmpR family regulator
MKRERDTMRLLLVEDSQDLARMFAEMLKGMGHQIDWVASAEAARLSLGLGSYAAVLLDLGLPDDDGLTVVRAIRARDRHTPIIVMTGRSGIDDRVLALRSGANDYLIKPIDLEELAARLDGLLDRAIDRAVDLIRLGGLCFDPADRHLECRGRALLLPARERALIELLLRRAGRVVRRETIEHQLYGAAGDHGSNVLDVLVHRLRRRLHDAGAGVAIRTLRGEGLAIVAEI